MPTCKTARVDQVDVRPLTPDDSAECDAIVASLPYHSGDAGGRAACARAVRESPGYVACEAERVIGFVTSQSWYGVAVEITWMAVHADRRRLGVGRRLIRHLVDNGPRNLRYMVVTTLSQATPEVEDGDTYAGTRRFYEREGFEPIWEPKGWWNDENQAVLMLRRLDAP